MKLSAPKMPTIDVSKLGGRYPVLFADNGGILRHCIGWQRSAESPDGACFFVGKTSVITGGAKVLERFPLTEAGWADAWRRLVELDRSAAEAIIRRLANIEAARTAMSGAVLPKAPPRFPSSVQTRRQILQAIASVHEKYARPFDRGKIALASLFGTESWSDYGNVVLQMAILDTLLSIEEKLGALIQPIDDAASADEPASGIGV
jgi:hypothetical protein